MLRYSLALPYNFAQVWTDFQGDTYTVSASTEPDQWEIEPQIVDYYDLSAPAWQFGLHAYHKLTKVNNSTYAGEYYFLQGEWHLLNSNPSQDFVVTAEPASLEVS